MGHLDVTLLWASIAALVGPAITGKGCGHLGDREGGLGEGRSDGDGVFAGERRTDPQLDRRSVEGQQGLEAVFGKAKPPSADVILPAPPDRSRMCARLLEDRLAIGFRTA